MSHYRWLSASTACLPHHIIELPLYHNRPLYIYQPPPFFVRKVQDPEQIVAERHNPHRFDGLMQVRLELLWSEQQVAFLKLQPRATSAKGGLVPCGQLVVFPQTPSRTCVFEAVAEWLEQSIDLLHPLDLEPVEGRGGASSAPDGLGPSTCPVVSLRSRAWIESETSEAILATRAAGALRLSNSLVVSLGPVTTGEPARCRSTEALGASDNSGLFCPQVRTFRSDNALFRGGASSDVLTGVSPSTFRAMAQNFLFVSVSPVLCSIIKST